MNNPNESAGHQHVSETGNYYAFARYYSPRLGRFMSADPLGGVTENPQSLNRYAYVLNNPTSFTDPAGLVCEPDFPNSNCESPSQHFGGGGFMGIDEFQLLQIPLTYTYYGFGPAQQGPSGIDATGTYSYAIRFWVWGLHTGTLFGSGFEFFSYGNSWGGMGSSPLAPAPQSQGSKQPLLVCAAETANKYSLAQLAGTNGKSGFWNSLANGILGNTFSTITEFAYGGSTTEFATTAYDYGTKATEGAINAATGAAPITDLGLGAESASQIAEGVATEGLGGIVTVGKLVYDAGTFLYGVGHCY